jgi:hypothetical protein
LVAPPAQPTTPAPSKTKKPRKKNSAQQAVNPG